MTPKPPVSAVPGRAVEAPVVRFGVFEVDLRNGELRKGGVLVKLQQQPFKVLALLVSRPGDIVTREELRGQIWGGDTFVDFDQGLNFCIKQIRVALGDQADTPRYVETLPRRGYRFIAPLERREPTGSEAPWRIRRGSSRGRQSRRPGNGAVNGRRSR